MSIEARNLAAGVSVGENESACPCCRAGKPHAVHSNPYAECRCLGACLLEDVAARVARTVRSGGGP